MQLTSPHFVNGSRIPDRFTCEGEDISPALHWTDVPNQTQSYVLIVRDPDAPAHEWIHWIVKNIPPTITAVADNEVPAGGVEVSNDFGRTSWGGPCPPRGEHRYFFELYAVDVASLDGQSLADCKDAMAGHTLASASLLGLYSR